MQRAPHDVEFGLFTEDAHSGEAVFGCVVSSAEEPSEKIVGNMQKLALVSVLLVVEVPEGPTLPVELFVP